MAAGRRQRRAGHPAVDQTDPVVDLKRRPRAWRAGAVAGRRGRRRSGSSRGCRSRRSSASRRGGPRRRRRRVRRCRSRLGSRRATLASGRPGAFLHAVLQQPELRLEEVRLQPRPVGAAFQLLRIADAGEPEPARRIAVREVWWRVHRTGPSQHRHRPGSRDGRSQAGTVPIWARNGKRAAAPSKVEPRHPGRVVVGAADREPARPFGRLRNAAPTPRPAAPRPSARRGASAR